MRNKLRIAGLAAASLLALGCSQQRYLQNNAGSNLRFPEKRYGYVFGTADGIPPHSRLLLHFSRPNPDGLSEIWRAFLADGLKEYGEEVSFAFLMEPGIWQLEGVEVRSKNPGANSGEVLMTHWETQTAQLVSFPVQRSALIYLGKLHFTGLDNLGEYGRMILEQMGTRKTLSGEVSNLKKSYSIGFLDERKQALTRLLSTDSKLSGYPKDFAVIDRLAAGNRSRGKLKLLSAKRASK